MNKQYTSKHIKRNSTTEIISFKKQPDLNGPTSEIYLKNDLSQTRTGLINDFVKKKHLHT